MIFASCGLELDKCQLKAEAHGYYHPGRSCVIYLGKNVLGYFGQIHPSIGQIFDIDSDIVAFELDLSKFFPGFERSFNDRSGPHVLEFQAHHGAAFARLVMLKPRHLPDVIVPFENGSVFKIRCIDHVNSLQ